MEDEKVVVVFVYSRPEEVLVLCLGSVVLWFVCRDVELVVVL